MGKPYTKERREAALEYLATHGGSFAAASRALGISRRSLRDWAKAAGSAETLKRRRETGGEETPGEARARLEQLALVKMLEEALRLSESLGEAIADAPLGQRATALNQLLDKILKVLALMSRQEAGQEEVHVRVVFQDADGSLHQTPYWARADSGE